MSVSSRLLFGINIDPASRNVALARELAREANVLGLDLIGIQDHPYIGSYLDTWTLLTHLGAITERVRLLTNVANLPLRTPAMLAKAAASLDLLAPGRVVLGLGAGGRSEDIAGYGGPRRSAGESIGALREGIEVMHALWGGNGEATVTVSGRYYRVTEAQPGPIPPTPIPIWLGVYKPRGLRLVGALADGWSPSEPYAPPETILPMQRIIDEAAEEAGRNPAAIARNYNLMGTILTPASGRLRPRDPKMRFAPAAEWVETIVRFARELQFNSFVYWPVAGGEREQLRLFAEEVVPAVRAELATG